jgi:hypothetical protein
MISDYFIHNFEVLAITESEDPGGAVVQTKTAAATDKGYFHALSGDERVNNSKLDVTATHKLLCSLKSAITEKNEIRYGGIDWSIVFIKDHALGVNRHKELILSYAESAQ